MNTRRFLATVLTTAFVAAAAVAAQAQDGTPPDETETGVFVTTVRARGQVVDGVIQHGPHFIDEDGDGFNDTAPDVDGDGIPNGADDDYIPPQDGSGQHMGRSGTTAGRGGNGTGEWRSSRGGADTAGRGRNGSGTGQGDQLHTRQHLQDGTGDQLQIRQRLQDGTGGGVDHTPGDGPGAGTRGSRASRGRGN